MAYSSMAAWATFFRDLTTVTGIGLAVISVFLALAGPAKLNTNRSSDEFVGKQHPILFKIFIAFGIIFFIFAFFMFIFDILYAIG
jgi:hypothetical protein